MKSQIIETVTIAQAKDTIVQAAGVYFATDQRGTYLLSRRRARPICLMGPAGIGKTEIVRQAAEELSLAFLSYSVTHHTRQSIIGLPRLVEGTAGGRTVSMTEYTMSEIIAQVYQVMEATGKDRGILFLDEFNCASESLRPIMLQLLQDKSFGPHAIPDGWMLVLAGNPSEYNRSASDLDPVTADRMRLVHIQPDYAAWRSYAKTHGIHPVVLSYLDNQKDHFYVHRRDEEGTALVTARGWEDLSLMMTCLEGNGQTPDLALVAQYIQAGDVARSFFTYYSQYAGIVASGLLEQVLERRPEALAAIKRLSFQKSWSLVSALARRLQTMAEEAAGLDDTTAEVHDALHTMEQARKNDHGELKGWDVMLTGRATQVTRDRPAARFLLSCAAMDLDSPEGWEAVKQRFRKEIRAPRMEAFRRTAAAVSNTLTVCRKALEGQPHLEFLFNAVTDSPALLRVISQSSSPEFRELFHDVSFDPEAAGRELNRAIAKSAEAARKEAV